MCIYIERERGGERRKGGGKDSELEMGLGRKKKKFTRKLQVP